MPIDLPFPPDPSPDEAIRCPGPWEHRNVSANGSRFHVAVQGSGPPVLLLHGFPQYWWTWRHALGDLAQAGYTAIAMDLRGYGGSDHTPRGYDPFSLSGDVSGVIRSMGYEGAVIVGHGWGGFVGWTTATLRPDLVRGFVPISMPHPTRLRRAFTSDPEQRRASRYAIGYQLPRRPERRLTADDAAEVGALMHRWSGTPSWPDPVAETYFRRAFQFRATAHCALEYHRWAVRSVPRPDGVRYLNRMEAPVYCPVLQLQGARDPAVLPRSVDGSEDFVAGPYRRVDLPSAGHFVHEEDPAGFAALLLDWLGGLPASPPVVSSAAPR